MGRLGWTVSRGPGSFGFERVGGEPLSIPLVSFFSAPMVDCLEGSGGGVRNSGAAFVSTVEIECRCKEFNLSILVTG